PEDGTGVDVVAAGVRDALALGAEGQPGGLGHGQRVDVAAQGDPPSAPLARVGADVADQPAARGAARGQACGGEPVEQEGGRLLLHPAQLGVGVDLAPDRDQLLLQLGGELGNSVSLRDVLHPSDPSAPQRRASGRRSTTSLSRWAWSVVVTRSASGVSTTTAPGSPSTATSRPVAGTRTAPALSAAGAGPSPSVRTPSAAAGSSVARERQSPTSSQPSSAGTTATPPSAATGSATAWSMAIRVRRGHSRA